MVKKKMKGFTLIELIAVLVIMAILALIVTPLVMNLIRKARVNADKRSIDAYGRSIELAVASYLLDTGRFPEDIDDLTIEYSGSRVVCSTTQLNPDSSVYLTGCTVAGRSVDYTYGTDTSPNYISYNVYDNYSYNDVDYYVIKNSGVKDSTLTLIKKEPLTIQEVNYYGGVGTEDNHVNMYPYNELCYQQSCNNNSSSVYGAMQYYSSETCNSMGGNGVSTGCTNDYDNSAIKYVVDAWAADNVSTNLIKARLITLEELTTDLGCSSTKCTNSKIKSSNYNYYTMTQYNDTNKYIWTVNSYGNFEGKSVDDDRFTVVRPVITIRKTPVS